MIAEKLFSNISTAELVLNFAIQSVILLSVGWAVCRLLKKKGAPLRSAVSLIILWVLLVLPFFSVVFHSFAVTSYRTVLPFAGDSSLNFFKPGEPEMEKNGSGQPFHALSHDMDSPGSRADQEKRSTVSTLFSGITVIKIVNGMGLIWLTGFFVFFCRFLYRLISVKRFKKGLRKIDDKDKRLKEILDLVRLTFANGPLPGVFTSNDVDTPVVLGVFKPVVVIPHRLYQTLSDNEIKSILYHELSHIYHRDQVTGILQEMVAAVYWWNPLVYRLSAYFSRAREDISDNYAIKRNSSREYAECLINLAERTTLISRLPLSIGMAASHIPLKERIKQILSKERIMDTKLKQSTTFMICFVSLVFTSFIIGHTWAFASQVIPQADREQVEDLTQRIDYLNQLLAARKYPGKMIHSLEKALPENVRLTELTFHNGKLTVTGEAASKDLVAAFVNNFKAAEGDIFGELKAGEKGPGKEPGTVAFSLTARYKDTAAAGDKNIKKAETEPKDQDLKKIKEEIKSKKNVLARLGSHLPEVKEVSPVLRKLQSILSSSKLKIYRMVTEPEYDSDNKKYRVHPLLIQVEGNFQQLGMCFDKVSQMEKMVIIDALKVQPAASSPGMKGSAFQVIFKVLLHVEKSKDRQ